FGFNENIDVTFPSAYPLAQIGNTGIRIGFTNAKLDFSRDSNIPEADADGRPKDFIGVYVQEATIGLPPSFTFGSGSSASIKGKNILIGTGGLSGNISLEANTPITQNFFAQFTLGGLGVKFLKFDMAFHMNRIIGSSIEAQLGIPQPGNSSAAPHWVDVIASFNENGDFIATAVLNYTISGCFGAFDIIIDRLGLLNQNNKWGVEVGGVLDFNFNASSGSALASLKEQLPKKIEIKKLIIWEDGKLDFVGGGFTLNRPIHFEVGPISLNLTNLSFSTDGKYGIFGFDGALDTGNAGVNVKGNGIKLYFAMEGSTEIFLKIQGIKVDIVIPGTATREEADILISGFLSVNNAGGLDPKGNSEYSGGVDFSIKTANIGGSAAMRMTPSIPAFIIDISIDLGVPIPLAATGLGIYGFRGLIASNYHVSKPAAGLSTEDDWWLYYKSKAPNPPGTEGVNIGKFDGYSGFGIGAGASIATMGDNGFTFSSKLFLMLGIPNLFLLQGQADFLATRLGLTGNEDPPFSAILSIDDNAISAGVGVDYKLPKDGGFAVMNMHAKMQMAYFFNNASGWYINFGKDKPEADRIKATLFELFDAYAYLMISAQGIKAGAGAKFEWEGDFGPVSVGLEAHVNIGGQISFSPLQLGGYVDLGGKVYASVYDFGFRIGVGAMLAAEAPKPFWIKGSFSISIGLPWPFDNIDIEVGLEFDDSPDKFHNHDKIDLINTSKKPAKAINMLTGESFDVLISDGSKPTSLPNDLPVIPLDSFIDIEFANVARLNITNLTNSNIKIGGNTEQHLAYTRQIPPQRALVLQDTHEFEINEVKVSYWNGTEWKPYNVWEQLFTTQDLTSLGISLERLKDLPLAYWQNVEPGTGKLSKLRILSQNPFSYMQSAHPGQIRLENWDYDLSKTYCGVGNVPTYKTINWMGSNMQYAYYICDQYTDLDDIVQLQPKSGTSNTVLSSVETFSDNEIYNHIGNSLTSKLTNAVTLDTDAGFEIRFKEKVKQFQIKFEVDNTDLNALRSTDVTYELYKNIQTGVNANGSPIYNDVLVGGVANKYTLGYYNYGSNHFVIDYNDEQNPVNRIVIKAVNKSKGAGYSETGYIFIGNCNPGEQFKGVIKDVVMFQRTQDGNYNNNQQILNKIGTWKLNDTGISPANGTFDINDQTAFSKLRDEAYLMLYFDSNTAQSYVLDMNANISNSVAVNPSSDGGGLIFDYSPARINAPANVMLGAFYDDGNPFYTHSAKYGFSCYFKTDNTDSNKRTILNRTAKYSHRYFTDFDTIGGVWHPHSLTTPQNIAKLNTYENGFEVYLLDQKLHIAIKYDKVYTISFDNIGTLTNNNWYYLYFDYDPLSRHLIVKLGASYTTTTDIYNNTIPDVFDFSLQKSKQIRLQQIGYYAVSRTEQDIINDVIPTASKMLMEAQDLNDGLNKSIQPVWRPDTIFAIEIKGQHKINGQVTPLDDTSHPSQIYNILFQTKGPVGYFHKFKNGTLHPKFNKLISAHPNGEERPEDEFRLLSIRDYIDYEKSFPNADGNLVNAKPVYWANPKINLLYIKSYLKLLYKKWNKLETAGTDIEYPLIIEIVDPVTNEVIKPTLDWKIGYSSSQEPGVEMMNNIKANIGFACSEANNNIQTIKRRSFEAEYTLGQVLKPTKMYQVNVYAKADTTTNSAKTKIHQFVFYTSKFESFNKHIHSYNISDTPILNVIDKDFTEAWVRLNKIITNDASIEALKTDYADVFDRAFQYGLSQLGSLGVPETIEVNVIKNHDNSHKLLLIRGPEPIFDPKIPFKYFTDNEVVKFNVSGLKYYISKDRSSVLVYNDSLDISVSSVDVTLYNPMYGTNTSGVSDYIKGAGETITIQIPN
ncbi:MAG: hypothetical protein NTU43_01665, partial [Bacteroidetes bacterium]|nr:hypothetical protein [Bacteroidota bacterium]